MPLGRARSVATTRTFPSEVDETDRARLLGRDGLIEVDVGAAVRGDDEVVGRHGNIAEVECGHDIPALVDVVNRRVEEGGDHERPVRQPAQPGRVRYLCLHGEVAGFAG